MSHCTITDTHKSESLNNKQICDSINRTSYQSKRITNIIPISSGQKDMNCVCATAIDESMEFVMVTMFRPFILFIYLLLRGCLSPSKSVFMLQFMWWQWFQCTRSAHSFCSICGCLHFVREFHSRLQLTLTSFNPRPIWNENFFQSWWFSAFHPSIFRDRLIYHSFSRSLAHIPSCSFSFSHHLMYTASGISLRSSSRKSSHKKM